MMSSFISVLGIEDTATEKVAVFFLIDNFCPFEFV